VTELVHCVIVTLTVTERADQLLHDKVPAHSTALVQVFFLGGGGKALHHPGLSAFLQPRVGSLQLLALPKAKIAVKKKGNVNVTVTQYTSSVNGVLLPID